MSKTGYRLLLAALVLSTTACSTGPTRPSAPVEESGGGQVLDTRPGDSTVTERPGNEGWRLETETPQPAPPATPENPRPAPSSAGAVDALVRQADGEYLRGDYSRAIATAERALRIDRRNAELYLILAKSYWQQALPAQSEQFARQGLRYSGSNGSVTAALQAVLAEAGRAR